MITPNQIDELVVYILERTYLYEECVASFVVPPTPFDTEWLHDFRMSGLTIRLQAASTHPGDTICDGNTVIKVNRVGPLISNASKMNRYYILEQLSLRLMQEAEKTRIELGLSDA